LRSPGIHRRNAPGEMGENLRKYPHPPGVIHRNRRVIHIRQAPQSADGAISGDGRKTDGQE